MRTKRCSRAEFLARTVAAGAGLITAAGPAIGLSAVTSPAESTHSEIAKVTRWALITLGNLSRNRYWGESDAKAVRPAVCTCTLIEGANFRLLVDPSLEDAQAMARELDRRSGLKPADITAVFITHEHADHYAGLAHFPEAQWFAGAEVTSLLNAPKKWSKPVQAASNRLFDALEVIPTPGHTIGLHSLRFDHNGLSIAVVGDAVATQDFWRERRGYFNCVDFELSARSMEKIARVANLVVPGHDNYFLVGAKK